MQELGRVLKEKREALGIDLDELQARTKIRKRYLLALESGDWSVLPGTVYARGFVRSYAESVGLDGQELLQKYVDEMTNAPPTSTNADTSAAVDEPESKPSAPPAFTSDIHLSTPIRTQPNRRRSRSTRSGRGVVAQTAAVVGALAIIGGAWWWIGKHGSQPGHGSAPVAASKQPHAANVTNQSQVSTAMPGNAADANGQTAVKPVSSVGLQRSAFDPATSSQSFVVTGIKHLKLVLTAKTGQCWVRVTADGKVVDASDMIIKGETKSWTASNSIVIRVGNVPAVTVSVNGKIVSLPNVNTAIDVAFHRS